MARVNYAKVEELIEQFLSQILIKKLLLLADMAANRGSEKVHSINEEQRNLIDAFHRDLKWLLNHDKKVFKKLDIDKKMLADLLDNLSSLDKEGWAIFKEIKIKLEQQKKKMLRLLTPKDNEKLIEQEKQKHIYKRHNVNEKWLPLK